MSYSTTISSAAGSVEAITPKTTPQTSVRVTERRFTDEKSVIDQHPLVRHRTELRTEIPTPDLPSGELKLKIPNGRGWPGPPASCWPWSRQGPRPILGFCQA